MNANGQGTTYRMVGKRTRPWAAVLVVGWTAEGRPIRRSRFASSEREAKAVLADMVRAHQSGLPLPDLRLTVGSYLRAWLALARPTVRPGTFDNYRRTVDAICADMGTVRLLTLQPSRVEAMCQRIPGAYAARNARDVLATAPARCEHYRAATVAVDVGAPDDHADQVPTSSEHDLG